MTDINCFEWLPTKYGSQTSRVLAGMNDGKILQISFPRKPAERSEALLQPYWIEQRYTHLPLDADPSQQQ